MFKSQWERQEQQITIKLFVVTVLQNIGGKPKQN